MKQSPEQPDKGFCKSCPYKEFDSQNLGQMYCKRMPPTPYPVGPGQTISIYPPTTPKQWCGEHPQRQKVVKGPLIELGTT